jgi:hypothetical protein
MIYFLSIINGEFIKIGFTAQAIEKRKAALQTGNPYQIDVLFTVEGSLEEEKIIHNALRGVFARVEVFSNPINEWYSGNNPIIKEFIQNVREIGLDESLERLQRIAYWNQPVKDEEKFTVRSIEKSLRKCGMSLRLAKTFISQNKCELIDFGIAKKNNPVEKSTNFILRKGPKWNQPGQMACVS